MKIVFLDIDGVLNNCLARGIVYWNSTLPECVARLNKITQQTGAKTCVISSWVDDPMFAGNNAKLKEFLEERGIDKGTIIGFRTEGLSKQDGIQQFVFRNEEIEDFVILDDNSEVVTNEYLKTKHLKTESLEGLQDHDVEKVVSMLS